MFPEHRELITELKQTDAHFAKLFHEHNDLDNQIDKLEREIEKMKRKKLQLKDELYRILESKKEE